MKTLLPSNENYTDLISFSGGRTSAYLAYLAKQNFKKPLFVFIDTGFEHPKTYEFIKNVDKAFNLNLVCIQSVISQKMGVGVRHKIVDINDIGFKPEIFTDYVTKNGSPVCVGATCSDRMKEKAFHSFAVTNEIRD